VAIAVGIVQFPWILKPFWGITSDSVPIFGYRRKSYLMIFGILSFFLWLNLAFQVKNRVPGVINLFLIQVCVAFCNVIGGKAFFKRILEALIVEVSQKKQRVLNLDEKDA